MTAFGKLVVAGVVGFGALQTVRPGIPSKLPTAEVQAPPEVRDVLDKSCYSCHSDQLRLSWFDELVPAYWLVRYDILTAREHLDFSTLGARPAAMQKGKLYEAVNMIQLGAMPLPSFVKLHPQAAVTPQELASLKAYLAPWTQGPYQRDSPAAETVPATAPAAVSLTTVQPEPDGFAFDPAFANWKPISITDRGDNYTFRSILGNEIAVKAAQSGNISPWPDGSRFAKLAWQQEAGPDGLIHPGKLVQVEMMLKDAQRYKATDGWGWGRWVGPNLEPFGKDAHFTNECTGCHQPMRGNDYVYTLPITRAAVRLTDAVNNQAAALPSSLPYQPLGWDPITMYVDPNRHTTAVLYGNDAAAQAARGRKAAPSVAPEYPAGAVLALVTWVEHDDPHWFGARIPGAPQSVEFIQLAAPGNTNTYRRFAGTELTEDHSDAATAEQRTSSLLALPPARMP